MKRTIARCVLPCVCLLLAGCKGGGERRTAPVEVKVCKAAVVPVQYGASYSGTVEETRGSVLSFAVGGTVEKILVREGQRVVRGQLIATLDRTSLEQAHEAAVAMLRQAEDAHERMKQLHDSGSLPEMQWVEVQSKLRQARSAESIACKNLTDSRLCAPFGGVISQKEVEAGQNVSPGMPVARLVDITGVKVCISVPESEMQAMDLGREARISVTALGDKDFTGTVSEKGVAANSLSRAYDVKIAVGNPRGELLPGMLCEVSVAGGSDAMAVVLPARVVELASDNRRFVWLYDKGKAVRRFVRTGDMTADGVTIVDGLAAGDEVIVEGQQKVSEGMEVVKQ